MRTHLLLAASVAALMAVPALAQEATDQATGQTTDQATDQATGQAADAAAADVTVTTDSAAASTDASTDAGTDATTTTTTSSATDAGAAVAATTTTTAADATALPLADAVALLNSAADNMGAVGSDQTLVTTDGTIDTNAPAFQDAVAQGNEALDRFEASLGSPDLDPARAEELRAEVARARERLAADPTLGGEALRELAGLAGQSQQAELSADARSMTERPVVTTDGERAGEVQDVLVTPDGRVEALVVGGAGALGLGGREVLVAWDRVTFQGDNLALDMSQDEFDLLPDYVTD